MISSTRSEVAAPRPQATPQADATAAAAGPAEGRARHGNGAAGGGDPPALAALCQAPVAQVRFGQHREYAWAAYLRAWVDRAERVGNLNYPDEARRRGLAGTVVINVGIRRNGSVERADIVQSSGIPLLDAAALRIAKLAEPYPPLPKTAEDPDILNVVRTWRFMPGGTLVDQ